MAMSTTNRKSADNHRPTSTNAPAPASIDRTTDGPTADTPGTFTRTHHRRTPPPPGLIRPRLRGWLHLGTTPLALAAGIVLVALSPPGPARAASAVYALSAAVLFAASAAYHLGRWSPVVRAVLRRVDHANIYLLIAGTYTPFLVLVLDGWLRTTMVGVVWGAAAAGVVFKVCWPGAPRWLSTGLYLGLGWVAVLFAVELVNGTHPATWILMLSGGLLYSVGAVVYALRRPDPAPRWFGYHEVFHALTIAAYVAHYVAVSFVVYTAG